MNIEEYRDYCVGDGRFIANMKCDTEWSAELIEHYSGITFGYHSDKKYWITVELESDLPDELIMRLISHSVEEVVRKMPKKMQKAYHDIRG